MSIWSGLVAIGVLLVVNAFFVAAEFSLVAVERARIDAASEAGEKSARRVRRLQESLTRHLSGAQFGITLAALLLGFVAEPTVARILSGDAQATGASIALAIGLATVLHLVVAEQVPKYVALAIPERTALALAPAITAYGVATRLLVDLLNRTANAIVRFLGVEPKGQIQTSRTLDELEDLIETSADDGSIDPDEATLLLRSIRFADKTAADALVPRVAIEALQRDEPATALVQLSLDSGHSRFPVYGVDLDDIVGVVHVKSLYGRPAAERGRVPVVDLMHQVLAVPETRELEDVLADMRVRRNQLAVVVDEHGGTAGIITLEDILEEILGEIGDETDRVEVRTRSEAQGSTVVSGRLNLDEVEEATGFRVPEGPYETLAGFVVARMGYLPEVSDMVVFDGWRIEVVAVDGHRVATLRIVAPGAPGCERVDPSR
ncbi:MAG: hemolysin family protein [Acidimicrobiales bacterium]|nr:hemolysin family protein [Acidimicrobiales bacterium]